MIEQSVSEKPWDHPYEVIDEYNVCIHCGLIGSYAHTEEYYVKYQGWKEGVEYVLNNPNASWNLPK